MRAILEEVVTRPTTRDLIRAATSTPDTHDEHLSAARFELFRRALILHDEAAWETLYPMYECLLASWISRRVTVPLETYDALLSDIWMKLLANIRTAEKFERFAGLGKLLAYLKCCTVSVCVDYIRREHRRETLFSLEQSEQDEYAAFGREPNVIDEADFQALLRMITSLLRTEQERLIVQVLLVEEERPSTLLKWYPGVFPSIEDIYTTRRRLIERLQRSQVLKAAKEAL